MKKFGRLVLAGVVILALTLALFAVRSSSSATPDYPKVAQVSGMAESVVDIPLGATGSEIAKILFEQGVTRSASAYFRVAVADPRSQKVAAGGHRLTKKIAATQALDQLLDPDRIPNLIKIFEGSWKSEVITSLKGYGFRAAQIQVGFASLKLPAGFVDAEGLLFPAQYTFESNTTASQVIQSMVDRFTMDTTGRRILAANGKFGPAALLTMASIVQAESETKDFGKVARVIYNRMKIGMPLQLDSTVHFVKKVRGQIFLSTQSTLVSSPYNTYKRYGLPPGPIGSPGAAAMASVLEPEVGNWLYFITVAPGDTRFTADITEFNSWKIIYQKNRKAGAFK